jgi:crossover junction endodeoxyribonuclease RuvC
METATRHATKSPPAAQTGRNGPILGIDPGLQRTGYAILDAPGGPETSRVIEAGVVRLNPRQPLVQRLLEIERSLDELISTHRPAIMVCEQLYAHYKHPRTAIIMAHARGVILALAARRGLAILDVEATRVKKHLTGSGRASKAQVQRAIAVALHLPQIPEPDDVADALAVALSGAHLRAAELREKNEAEGGA